MGRIETAEALVLKTYDVGEADRLAVLLTNTRGRILVRAKSVRKLNSKWGPSILSFQHLRVDLAEHSSGFYLRSAEVLTSHPAIRTDLSRFAIASRGAELLLHFLHDTEPSEEIFALAREYFLLCDSASLTLLFPTFQLMLLSELGLLPSFTEDTSLTENLRSYLHSDQSITYRIEHELSATEEKALNALCAELLQNHLSFPMKSVTVESVLAPRYDRNRSLAA